MFRRLVALSKINAVWQEQQLINSTCLAATWFQCNSNLALIHVFSPSRIFVLKTML